MRPERIGVVACVGVLAAAVAWPRVAGAMCAEPRPQLSLPDGATAPPDPVVYAFVPSETRRVGARARGPGPAIRVTAGGREVPTRFTVVDHELAVHVYRLEIRRRRAGAIEVHIGDARFPLRIDPGWRRPDGASLAVRSAVYDASSWTCSYEETLTLRLDPALASAAYRVEVGTDGPPFDRERTVVVPGRRGGFHSAEPPAEPTAIALGHLDCVGGNVALEGLRTLRITALLPDGGERAGTEIDAAALLREAKAAFVPRPDPFEELGRHRAAMTRFATEPPPLAPAAPPAARAAKDDAGPDDATYVGAYLLGLIAGLVALAAARAVRRRRTARMPRREC